VMLAKRSERRKARRAQKQGAEAPPAAAAAPLPGPEVLAVPPPQPDAAIDDLTEELTEVAVQPWLDDEAGQLGDSLPSFDDFRRRDEERLSPVAPPPFVGLPTVPAPQDPRPVADAPKTAQESLMELLSFDQIDERPANEEPYDLTARLIGRGLPNSADVYLLPYLQSGHILLLLVLLLSSFISYPGFPLTQVPDEYRGLLQIGLVITYAINAVCAVYARGIAEAKQQPVSFWTAKVLLLGGLALGELTEAVPEPPAPKKRR